MWGQMLMCVLLVVSWVHWSNLRTLPMTSFEPLRIIYAVKERRHRNVQEGSDQLDPHAIKTGNRDVIHSGSTGAHLVMVPIKGSPPAWTAHDDYHVTFCANVACDNGTIWVRDAGIYLVYSHITLNVTRGSTYTIFTHRMHLTRRNMPPKQLLMSKTSFTRTASPKRNSFLSAVLKLEERDAIGVYIPDQNTDLVEKGGFSNFMGIFKL
ncbi:uncharacterized protein LOC124127145 [Haliotis rufescens]|uniref:uncharacterized protein LOC124127145 n=1 Tax=Haliotis rufescens TaxID=6454 RepID=UPI00201EA868|nr:uncharacterized protein LOC124127145 [Haliotis rufescens]